jgi:hypothetical protein
MPKTILLAEIISILESGHFDRLLGGLEDEHLECKREPYKLQLDAEKMELAKDISALANADGGIILIGVKTEKDPTVAGDVIRHCGCFIEGFVDFNQYENVLLDWVIPSIRGLKFKWHPSALNPKEGIVSIFVPQTVCQERPFIVGKIIEDTGELSGSHIGYFERKRDGVPPMKAPELRERLKDGLRFAELNARLMNVEEMVGKAAARDMAQPPALPTEEVLKRVQRAREEMVLGKRATFSLAVWPEEAINFPGLFDSREDPVARLLERPPQLRNGGFGLLSGRPSIIVEGKLRRCSAPGYRLLEVWRDGALISMMEGDGGHLCWGMDSTDEVGLKINNLALTETVYLFCDWALKIYKLAVPNPTRLNFRMIFSAMNPTGRPFHLNPHPAGGHGFRFFDNGRASPDRAGQHFQIQINFNNAEPGIVAYKLLVELYLWFGFNTKEVPYVSGENESVKIDLEEIVSSAMR